jgi:polygalacturonase
MRDITSAPIFLRLGARMRGPAGTPVGTLKRVNISNVVCSNAVSPFGSIISGIPGHDVEDVTISHVQIWHQGGGTKQQAASEPPEKETAYPEPDMFGKMPSQGFYVRHAKDIRFDDVEIRSANEDERPAFVMEDVRDADFFRIRTPLAAGAPAFALHNIADFAVHMCRSVPDTVLPHAERATL